MNINQQIEQDDKDAINKDNVLKGITRGASPREGYKEPNDLSVEDIEGK